MEKAVVPPLEAFIGHWYFQHEARQWNGSHVVKYYYYFIPSDLHLKNAVVIAYSDTLSTATTTKADCKAIKAVKAYEQEVVDLEIEWSADVSEIVSYFIFSELPEHCTLIPLLPHSASVYCL